MDSPNPFAVNDCSLARLATGRTCTNLRELLDLMRSASDAVIEHHMMRCVLDDHFELYEFPNDFARWCWTGLGDHVLGEQLGLIDPYQFEGLSTLRATLVNAIENRLWGIDRVPWCRPGLELYPVESRLITYDTGERVSTVAGLREAVQRMSLRSIFYHVHEARRRTCGASDDFSLWLEAVGASRDLVTAIRKIDFYFLNLNQTRAELLNVIGLHLADPTLHREVA